MPAATWLEHTSFVLTRFCNQNIENKRKALVISALLSCGNFSPPTNWIAEIVSSQKQDGGFSDPLETAHSAYLMKNIANQQSFQSACSWLLNNKSDSVAWGHSIRDIPRIPVTGWIVTFLPEIADQAMNKWLSNEWAKDLSSDTPLTYKGAIFLKVMSSVDYVYSPLISNTLRFLAEQQNDDGGFAPWKDHPIGSEPWSTGIALIGLSSWPDVVDHDVLVKALDWLGRNQLPNGLWPCHYIEEGSAYCYWGAVEALKVLKKAGHPCAV